MSDAAFSARVGRIKTGQTWTPDGIVQPKFRGRRRKTLPLTQQPWFRFTVIASIAAVCAVAMVDPSGLPPEIQALLDPDALAEKAVGIEGRARALLSLL